ncbi:Rib/alpha-like domain-containing protein [Staphylococcus chromogenes]|uniref:Rib/alpha-like domain-containing protein n=1 Tax=Staphylococcus chromogenes TaxID=46126 RepID=UPI0018909DF1|nr:Rib/alpha-like domain-containing protein [Staphylococcus chromogenes]
MTKKNKARSRRYDYLPNRANKYSIRKFTVGTTSILIGATLVFGIDHDAKAAETTTPPATSTTTASDTTAQPATTDTTASTNTTDSTSTATSTAQSTTADSTTQSTDSTNTTNSTSTSTAQSTTADSTTQSTDSTNTATSTSTADTSTSASTAQSTTADSTTQSTDSTNTTTSTSTADTSTSTSTAQSTTSDSTTQSTASTDTTTSTSIADTSASTSTTSSTVATSTSTSTASASTASTTATSTSTSTSTTSSTTLSNFSLMSAAAPMAVAAVAPANTDVVAEQNNIITADAIANGYIKTATDATNAANTLSGRAWLIDSGTPATMANGLTPVPEGTPVYMQWIDTDGAVSPIYRASTTNKLSSVDGSQVGPGAYAFDLREPWVDANGTSHTYRAIDGQYYRLWINDFTTANGNTATMLRQAGGFYPDTFVNSVTGSNLGQFPLIGTNMQRTGIFMSIVPTNNYMTTNNWIVDNQGPLTNPSTTTSVNDFISGKVWLESGAGDYANSATGPNYNAPSDVAGAGYQVVMSSLTAEGAKAYDAYVNSLPKDQQTAAARTLLQANPQYISATVTGYTDANGNYTLRFPSGALDLNHVYGYVLDPKGNLVKSYSAFTTPLFRPADANLSFTPQTAPYVRPVRHAWVNVNFAVVGTNLTNINITNFDVTANPAKPGDVAYVDVTTTALSPLPTYVEWRDSAGNVVQRSAQVTTEQEAEVAGTFTIPTNAKSGEVYTVYIVSGGNDIAADSLIVQVDQNSATYQPTYPTTTVSQGQTLVVNPPLNNDGTALPTGTSFESGNNVPTWATVNADGSITVAPDAAVTPGSYNVPVVVTYPDGSRETVYAPVTVKAPDATVFNPTATPVDTPYGTATTADQVTSNVTIPGYPTTGPQPVISVNDPSQLPDGTTPGTVNVPVTVTYPDGSTDQITVPVTTGQPQATQFDPTVTPVNNPYGTATTADQVTSNVTIPGYPTTGPQPVISVNDPSQLPNGTTPGTVNVPVTVTYPDGSTDQITVPVTTGVSQATQYDPTANPVNNPYGTATTADQITGNITVPGFPTTGAQPTYTIPVGTVLPDGTTPGTVDVPVTVTYPDGTTDQITVPVTTGQPQATTYQPVGDQVNNPFGTPTTENQIVDAVIIPGYPTTGPQPVISVNDPSTLPDGQTSGTVDVSVTVTYPDGSTDQITVPVTTGNTQATQYDPTATPVTNPYGTPTTQDQVLSNVTVPGFPTTGAQPSYTLADGATLPDGTQSGTYNVPVVVTYPDGSKDTISVPVTVGDAQAVTYDPTSTPVDTPFGTATTENDVVSHVAVPGYPTTGVQPTIKVDNGTSLPDGQTPGTYNVPVTVTYPDGSVDHITVPVTVGQPQATQYDPTATPISNPYGTATTADQVLGNVSVPGFPTNGAQPSYTLADGAILPNGTQSGTFNVPVVVTYPDGSKDTINVPVTVGDAQAVTYEPSATPISNPYGTATTSDQVLGNVTVPGFPTNGAQPSYTLADGATLPDGTQSGTFNVPVVVTYPDGTTDMINVPVTVGDAQAVTYEPTATPIDKNYGSATSEADVVSAVTVPNFPTTGDQPTITVDDPTTLPDGQTPGNYNVPVTVTYPDGSQDHISVPITVGSTEASTYQPTATAVETPFGTPTTADEVIGNVTIPEYPTTGEQPVNTVDDPTTLPDGQTPGNYTVPVTVTYPDGSQDHITVPVTVTPSQASTYNPTAGVVNNPYGTPTTEAQVTSEVTVTGYPSTGPQPVITVDNPAALPDGSVTGTVDVPVTITYPDGSVDHVTVSVSTGDSQAVTYEPTATPINKPYGTPTTNQDMISHVTIPGYPTTGEQPIINAIDPNTLPTGYTSGTFEVPVLVTYPDGTSDSIIVTVTVDAQPQNNQYEPVTSQVNQPYGTPTTETDVVGKVTIPGYPTTGDQPVITVDNPSSLPDGTASGTYDVPVTVTYPDGTTDHITVPVVVGAQPQNTAYEPITTSVEKPYGTPTTTDDITGSVTVPGYPTTGDQPVITVDNPSTLPDGTTPGTYEVPVTVTYPDGTTDHVTVPVTVGTSQATQFDPTVTTVNTPYGTPTTEADVVGNVTIPGYPTTGDQPVITVDNPSSLPDGTIPGTVDVPVTVTYPDGSVDKITVPVTTGEAQATTNEPTATPVENPYGTPTTVDDITSSVTVPGYPTTGDQPVVTVDNPSTLPDGTTPDTVDVPVTVTYPDGSVDKITVPVTTGVAQATTYEPTTTPVEKSFGTPTTVDDITSSVTVPGYSTTGDQPVITVDNPSTLPDGQTPGTYDVPVTVTYPDGSQDHTTVTVTVGESQATQYEPVTGPVNNAYGTPTTEDQVVAQVTVPNFPTTGEQPVITVDNPLSLPDGQTPGTVDVSVTVTYPDGTVDHTAVTVNTGDTQATQYEPTATPVDNPYGTPTTENQVLDQVTVPNYPTTGDQPTYTIPSGTTLPDGSQSGTFNVPVIVRYPDGSQDMINVPVTVGESQATTNEPTTTPVEKPFGTPTTVDDITSSVTVPGYPTTGDQPVVTVDNPTSLPDGTTPGTYEVPVTVTYPDGSQDHTTVTVTVGESQAATNEPTTTPVEKPFGTPTTVDDITSSVTVPGYPATGDQPVITVDNPSSLPDGTTPGTYEVPVTVTYPDGSQDHTVVTVTVGESQATTNEPTTTPVEKPFGTPTTTDDITSSVTVPGYPTTGDQPVVTVDNPSSLPDGTTPGTYEVPVTVTYPDGSQDHTVVTVIVGEPQANTYEPTTTPVEKPNGTPTTTEDITGSVTVPNFPTTGEQPVITVDNPSTLPDGTTPGTVDVPVTVTYPDGSEDHTTVPVTVGEPQANTYEPTTTPVEKPNGTPTTVDDVTGSVTVPNFPTTGDQPVVTVDDPSTLPDGTTPGTVEVPVTVTYPDGSEDHTTVPVIVGEPQANTYEPTTTPVEKPNGTPTTVDDITGSVTVPNFPPTGEQPVITVDNPSTLPDGTTPGTVEVPVTVTYPDGSEDHTTVTVTTGVSQAEQNNPGYHDGVAKPGETIHLPQNGDSNMPDGTKYEVTPHVPSGWNITVDETTGELTVTPPNNAQPGTSIVTEVIVHYPDGSTEVVQIIITVGEKSETPLPSPIPHVPSTPNRDTITGEHATPGHSICVTWPNGSVTTVPVKKDGSWSVAIPKNIENQPEQRINIVEINHQGQVSKPTTIQKEHAPEKAGQHELPETGQSSEKTSPILLGGLFAALGSLLLFRRKKQDKETK